MNTCQHGPINNPANRFNQQPVFAATAVRWLQLLSLLLGLYSFATSNDLNAANNLVAADSVFRFQSKMAQRGHVASQYALAYMYESGQGTDKDLSLASHWYRQAAQQGFAPAKDRLVYIDIQNNGYRPQHQQQWLLSLKQTADDYNHKHQGESAFLLAQLYAAGIAVNKSLSLALRYLHLAEAANVIGSDSEIRRVETELEALREIYMPADKDTSENAGKPASSNTITPLNKQQTGSRAAQASANKSPARQNNSQTLKPAKPAEPRPVPRPALQSTGQAKSVVNPKPVTSQAAAETTDATAASTRNRPPAEQNNKAEQPEPHPMQVICSGWQRLNSACR